ncbi:MAG: MBL fold metallo-hydrolase [Candidatus Lokiarchaeota archaeon]|nr:MBL fold metallo-hydrolase [Candidatus Lokiarchaeota archaeon]MBD3199847.1 MBL fold metallo-hydrolase [Candidatus Lokiarchaeota archaeon]
MGFINEEGKFNENSYMIDGLIFRLPKQLSVYVVENEGERLMIDTGVALSTRKVIKKLKEFNLFPIHKLFLTHSHWDHVQGYNKLKKAMPDFETLASEKAIDNLKNPEKLNDIYGYKVNSIDNVTPLKEADIIDLNGLELEVINLFGHTQDSVGLIDWKNKNIFTGDAIASQMDRETYQPILMPPDFNEQELLNSFKKVKALKDELKSISLNHFGVWTNEDFYELLGKLTELHITTKDAIIEWYKEAPSLKYIAEQYHKTFIPDSTIHTEENLMGFEMVMEWVINGLKTSGLID